MPKITALKGRAVFNSRGSKTIEIDVFTDNRYLGRACAPSGASVGKYEAQSCHLNHRFLRHCRFFRRTKPQPERAFRYGRNRCSLHGTFRLEHQPCENEARIGRRLSQKHRAKLQGHDGRRKEAGPDHGLQGDDR